MKSNPLLLSLFAFSLTSAVVAQADDAADWAELLRGSASRGVAPAVLQGGLRPILGKTGTVQLTAKGMRSASLFIGGTAHSGVPLQLTGGTLRAYVTSPLYVVPLQLRSGVGAFSAKIPNDASLVGVDLAMQAIATNGAAWSASNLLLGNLGRKSAWATFDVSFAGVAPKQQATHQGRIYAGDVLVGGVSAPVYSNLTGHYVALTVLVDRPITRCLEIRTGSQGTGVLLGKVCKQREVVNIKVPSGGLPGIVHVYLHNTDRSRGVGVVWRIAQH